MPQHRSPTAIIISLILITLTGLGGYLIFREKPIGPTTSVAERPLNGDPEAPSDVRSPAGNAAKDSPDYEDLKKAPVVVDIIAAYPGASVEEVERQVTIPLEVTLAGMKGLESVRSTSQFESSRVHARFKPGTDEAAARQEIVNRLQAMTQLPAGVEPRIAAGQRDEGLRYILRGPLDANGAPIYSANDLRTLQDSVLSRELRRIPGVADVTSRGGSLKRFEIQIDPQRLTAHGVTVEQIRNALSKTNANMGGDFALPELPGLNIRGEGLLSAGRDPFQKVMNLKHPDKQAAKDLEAAEREMKSNVPQLREQQRRRLAALAAKMLAEEDEKRIAALRKIALTSVGKMVLLEEVAAVVVESQPPEGSGRSEEYNSVQGVIHIRPGADPWLVVEVGRRLGASSGKLLPGVHIEPYFSQHDGEQKAHVLEIVGPDLADLQRLALAAQNVFRKMPGIENATAPALGSSNRQIGIDPDKCKRWGISAADANALLQVALGGMLVGQMVEGEKSFDIALRWLHRGDENQILNLPVNIINNSVLPSGKSDDTASKSTPRIRLRDLVAPADDKVRPGASVIYRLDGQRSIPVRIKLQERAWAEVQAEVAKKMEPFVGAPYRLVWTD